MTQSPIETVSAMTPISRILSGFAVIGEGIVMYRVFSLIWPVAPVETILIFLALFHMALHHTHEFLFGRELP